MEHLSPTLDQSHHLVETSSLGVMVGGDAYCVIIGSTCACKGKMGPAPSSTVTFQKMNWVLNTQRRKEERLLALFQLALWMEETKGEISPWAWVVAAQ